MFFNSVIGQTLELVVENVASVVPNTDALNRAECSRVIASGTSREFIPVSVLEKNGDESLKLTKGQLLRATAIKVNSTDGRVECLC